MLACAGLLLAHTVLTDRASELIAFASIKPGDKVADFMPDGGYITRLFCKVVGDAGHVYVIGVPPKSVPSASEAADACHNVKTSNLKS